MALFGRNTVTTRRDSPKKPLGEKIKSALGMVLPRRKRKAPEPITGTFRVLRTRRYSGGIDVTRWEGDEPLPKDAASAAALAAKTPIPKTLAPVASSSSSRPPPAKKIKPSETEKLKTLEEESKNVPRYLFRACSPSSGGGLKGLNTIDGVFPHAFVDVDGKKIPDGGAKSIHDLPYQVARRMAIGHLSGQRPTRTDPTYSQYSSWAASFALVLQYGHSRAAVGGLICVLDRYKLPKNTKVYHCPAMMRAGLCDSPYDHEYLVHGPVEGPGFKAVTVARLVEMGLYTEIPCVLPTSGRYWWGQIPQKDWEALFPPKAITEKQVRSLRTIAEEFGKDFTLPVLAAFLTLDRRKLDAAGQLCPKEVKIFADVVNDLYIPEEYGTDNSIVQPDGIYIQGYPMVAQLAALLKALVEYNYGRGVRVRRRLEVEDLSSELEALGLPEKTRISLDVGDKFRGGVSTGFAFGVKDVVLEASSSATAAVC
ncbi:hypothetical protein TWF694_011815 [Orbilia ellipsospora]|uniref:Uncharacterized protein n=1 Tax=Orbilia ellipsospora TaxID=2528407 RepID=A0AAV9X7K8_9PEZI